jgi:predicted DNA-binding protein (UPF0251 family)
MPRSKRNKGGRPKGARNKQLNPKVEKAVDLIEAAALKGENLTITDAAKQVGLRRESLSRMLHRDDIAARALQRGREMLGGATVIRAAAQIHKLIKADSEYVQLDASKHVLAIAGIKPKEQGGGGSGKVSVTFNLQHIRPGLVDVTPAVQIEHSKPDDDDAQ